MGSHNLNPHSRAILLTKGDSDAETHASTTLEWHWSLNTETHTFSSYLYGFIEGTNTQATLILAGPISSSRVATCRDLNEAQVQLDEGPPVSLGFKIPEEVSSALRLYEKKAVSHFDLEITSGQMVQFACSFHGFATDDPPLHRLHTPALIAYAHGSETASSEQLHVHPVCVIPSSDNTVCATEYDLEASSFSQDEVVSRPEEQGIRDSRLVFLGAITGVATTLLVDFFAGASGWLNGIRCRFRIRHLSASRKRTQH